jgi:hypothetical protein
MKPSNKLFHPFRRKDEATCSSASRTIQLGLRRIPSEEGIQRCTRAAGSSGSQVGPSALPKKHRRINHDPIKPQEKAGLQTTSCCNATAGNVDDWKFPKKPTIAPSRAIAADDMPGYAAPPKKRGTAWRPACRDPSLRTTTSFPEGSKRNRSSR